jgi:putative hydrolase of the HAD superfamily
MALQDFQAFTFDVVGTLIDFETGVLDYIGSKRKGLDERTILEAYATAEDHQHHLTPYIPFPSMLKPIYREMAVALGLPDSEADAAGLRLSIPHWPVFADSISALKRLRKHARLVAMTNSDNWALDHFAEALQQPFDARVTAEDVERNKPDPQFWSYARGKLGLKTREILHVAQSQYHDIATASALGYTVCWIERRKGKTGSGATPGVATITTPDYHFTSLAELADAVEQGA